MTPRVDLAWEAVQPARIRALLAAIGWRSGPADEMRIEGLALRVVQGTGPDRLRTVGEPHASPGLPRPRAGLRLLATGIATIDTERAATERGGEVRGLRPDTLLGARVALAATSGWVLLEPSREGRLAATLARNGEGPAALYLGTPEAMLEAAVQAVEELGMHPRRGEGPFGPQILAWSRPPWGPHILLVPGRGDAGSPDVAALEPVRPVPSGS